MYITKIRIKNLYSQLYTLVSRNTVNPLRNYSTWQKQVPAP